LEEVKHLVIIVILCVGCAATNAQTFTQRLQQSKSGEGKVTVTQDKAIDNLVNGPKTTATAVVRTQPTPQKQTDPKTTTATTTSKPDTGTTQRTTAAPLRQQPDTTATEDATIRKKVMKGGYKVNGFRVQVYAGGNSRDARIKAERIGREINALFPGEPVYVHFYSPRWICRMGNYRSYEEASQILRSVKKLGYSSATIVKGKITVPSASSEEEPETSTP
jgi:hypothetical protein